MGPKTLKVLISEFPISSDTSAVLVSIHGLLGSEDVLHYFLGLK